MEEMITITKEEYEKLLKDSRWLNCLEAAGVDNWCGYEFAYDIKKDTYGEDDDE